MVFEGKGERIEVSIQVFKSFWDSGLGPKSKDTEKS